MKQLLKLGMVGAGFVAKFHARAIMQVRNIQIDGVVSRGLLAVQYNEPDLYGYTDENEDAAAAFHAGRDGLLPLSDGLEITKLCMAGYMAAERKKAIDLTDPAVQKKLETYVPLIQQGRGAEVLL
jgi:predicted dehydrogenase